MKNYIDPVTNDVYAYDADGAQDAFIRDGLIQISDADLATLRTPKFDDLKAQAISQVRNVRRSVFSTLAGMQSEALAKGDGATATAISSIQQKLRDLPDIDLSACKTQADIDGAFVASWAAIVASAPANVVSAFNRIG